MYMIFITETQNKTVQTNLAAELFLKTTYSHEEICRKRFLHISTYLRLIGIVVTPITMIILTPVTLTSFTVKYSVQ